MLLVTVPHSGETIPPEATWLQGVDASVLLTDVDRFVDQLYAPVCQRLGLPLIAASCHRYAVDLNRVPSDIDGTLVEGAGAPDPAAKFVSGFHWSRTTKGVPLLTKPMGRATHQTLVIRYHDEFHQRVRAAEQALITAHGLPRYHLDVHSMPSQGTGAHKDSGQKRPDIVVSDCEGKSASSEYKDAALAAFRAQGFEVAYNWPYKGGRMTEQYGRPGELRHSLQIELNRALYMSENTREKNAGFDATSARLDAAVAALVAGLRR